MFDAVLVLLALIAIGIVGCVLVATFGCLSAAAEFCVNRYRGLRAARSGAVTR